MKLTKELIIDALGNIDDDLISDVDILRTSNTARPKHMWHTTFAAAACLCILAVGVIFVGRYYSPFIGTDGATPEYSGGSLTGAAQGDGGEPFTYPETLDCSNLDLTSVRSIDIHCGFNGERVLVTDPDDIKEITDAILCIKGEAPESSRGYYGWTYSVGLYDVEAPTEDTEPIWQCAVSYGKVISGHIYETVNGVEYRAMYDMTGITTDEFDAVCEKHFPSVYGGN